MPDDASKAGQAADNAKPKGNPAFRALGLPNFRLRLPSRNWTIFLTIVGGWTGTLLYDRRQKRLVQEKWATLVQHIADEPVPTHGVPRQVTVFLAAPPGDGLRSAREHFLEYVKPVLAAASLTWDVVEGRREGDVRAGLAERVRRFRRKHGETATTEAQMTIQDAVENSRQRTGVFEAYEIGGDIVIGRHTWKEYMRGLHEGWLGPMDPPPPPTEPTPEPAPEATSEPAETIPAPDASAPAPASASAEETQEKNGEEKKPEEKPKPLVTPPYNTPAQYPEANLPRSIPAEFSPSAPVSFPHLLGFRNTPIRMYRYLTQRYMADEIGRQTAAAVLAAHRPYRTTPGDDPQDQYEQRHELEKEERDWMKRDTKRDENDPGKERELLDDIVLDQRIVERMRRFEVTADDEERARRIGNGSSGIPGRRDPPQLSDYEE